MHEISDKTKERAILVGAGKHCNDVTGKDSPDHLEELRLLADTAGADVVGTISQYHTEISPIYFIGKGKANELKTEVERVNANIVIFDADLTPAQVSNLQKLLNIKVVDRSGLILDIFALRARTSEAKAQVELAQLKYLLPRLTRQWTHLSRQEGGIGTRSGPGETQLEVDRRRIRQRIGHLTNILKKIEQRHDTARKRRSGNFKAALVGYTNAGKSTLLNAISGASVPVEDKLFKTLDSVTKLVKFESTPEILISDTVGFIRNLPHDLIASFKSTLAEVREADVLLHVVDITHPEWEEQVDVVVSVLFDLGVSDTETIMVFNKIDRLNCTLFLDSLKTRYPHAVCVSGKYGYGIEELQTALKKAILKERLTLTLELNPEDSLTISNIYRFGTILETHVNGDSIRLTFTIPRSIALKLNLANTTLNKYQTSQN